MKKMLLYLFTLMLFSGFASCITATQFKSGLVYCSTGLPDARTDRLFNQKMSKAARDIESLKKVNPQGVTRRRKDFLALKYKRSVYHIKNFHHQCVYRKEAEYPFVWAKPLQKNIREGINNCNGVLPVKTTDNRMAQQSHELLKIALLHKRCAQRGNQNCKSVRKSP